MRYIVPCGPRVMTDLRFRTGGCGFANVVDRSPIDRLPHTHAHRCAIVANQVALQRRSGKTCVLCLPFAGSPLPELGQAVLGLTWFIGFQRGVMVASRSQLGLPA